MPTFGLVIVLAVFVLLFFGVAYALTYKGSGITRRGGEDESGSGSSGGASAVEQGGSDASRRGGTE